MSAFDMPSFHVNDRTEENHMDIASHDPEATTLAFIATYFDDATFASLAAHLDAAGGAS